MSEKIPPGTHLMAIIEAETVRITGKRLTNEGSYAIKVKFSTGDNKTHEERFWTLRSDFKQLCKATEVDLSKPICPELLGKRLWGVFDSECKPVGYIKCENPLHEPVSVESTSENIKVDKREQAGETVYFITKTQKEKLDLGKKIIAETMKKPLTSLNQKNKPKDPIIEDHKSDPDWDLL